MTNAIDKLTTNPDAVKPNIPPLEAAARAMFSKLYPDGKWDGSSTPALSFTYEEWCQAFRAGLLRLLEIGDHSIEDCAGRAFINHIAGQS